jgi:hypothetical protein
MTFIYILPKIGRCLKDFFLMIQFLNVTFKYLPIRSGDYFFSMNTGWFAR